MNEDRLTFILLVGAAGSIGAYYIVSKFFGVVKDEFLSNIEENEKNKEFEDDKINPVLYRHGSLWTLPEYGFWSKFFRKFDIVLETEFMKRVYNSKTHSISWDFCNVACGEFCVKGGGYVNALNRVLYMLRHEPMNWKNRDLDLLSFFAKETRQERRKNLQNEKGSRKYKSLLEVFKLWVDICDAVDDLRLIINPGGEVIEKLPPMDYY